MVIKSIETLWNWVVLRNKGLCCINGAKLYSHAEVILSDIGTNVICHDVPKYVQEEYRTSNCAFAKRNI